MPPRMTGPSESQIQQQICQWLDANGIAYTSIPNNPGRSERHAARLKREGMQVGIPDLLVITPPPSAPERGMCVWIEVKSATGRLRTEQEDWHGRLHGMGHEVLVVRGLHDAIAALRQLGYGVRR